MNKEQEELIIRALHHIEDILTEREPTYTMVMDDEFLEPEIREKVGDRIADAFNDARGAAWDYVYRHSNQ